MKIHFSGTISVDFDPKEEHLLDLLEEFFKRQLDQAVESSGKTLEYNPEDFYINGKVDKVSYKKVLERFGFSNVASAIVAGTDDWRIGPRVKPEELPKITKDQALAISKIGVGIWEQIRVFQNKLHSKEEPFYPYSPVDFKGVREGQKIIDILREFKIPERAVNCIFRRGLGDYNLEGFLKLTETDFRSVRGLGVKSIDELLEFQIKMKTEGPEMFTK